MKSRLPRLQSYLKNPSQGFTMIELLIVMMLIGALATIFVASYPASQSRSRDTIRRNDLRQYEIALRQFASRNRGFFPSWTTATLMSSSSFCTGLGLTGTTCAADPRNGQSVCGGQTCGYYYISNGTNGTPNATKYVLWSRLEQNDLGASWTLCSNGQTGYSTSGGGAGADCPITAAYPTGGPTGGPTGAASPTPTGVSATSAPSPTSAGVPTATPTSGGPMPPTSTPRNSPTPTTSPF